jgi:hypothetical protein
MASFWASVRDQIWKQPFLKGIETLFTTTPGCERLPTTVDRALVKPMEEYPNMHEEMYDNLDMVAYVQPWADWNEEAWLEFQAVWWSPVTNYGISLLIKDSSDGIFAAVKAMNRANWRGNEVFTCDSFLFTPEQNRNVINALLGALETHGLVTGSLPEQASQPERPAQG